MKKTKLTRSLLAACSIVALTAVMYGCVHGGDDEPAATDMTDPPAPDPEPDPEPDPALGEAQSAAAAAAAAAKAASDSAAAAVAAVAGSSADVASLTRAQDAAEHAMAAYMAAKAASDAAAMATDTAVAEGHQATAEEQQTEAETALANAMTFADMVAMAQQAIDDAAQEVIDLAAEKDAAQMAATAARTAATNAQTAADKVAELAGASSMQAMAAQEDADAADMAADAAEAANDLAQAAMTSGEAAGHRADAESAQTDAMNAQMDAAEKQREAQVASDVGDEQQEARDIEAAMAATKDAAEAASIWAMYAQEDADSAQDNADEARAAANRAMAARTNYADANAEAEAAETAAAAAQAAADAAASANIAAQAAYMAVMGATTSDDAEMYQMNAETALYAAHGGAMDAYAELGNAATAAGNAATAESTHVLGLFTMANAYHITTAEDLEANTDGTEAELIDANKAAHVAAVNLAIRAAAIAANHGGGSAAVTWPYPSAGDDGIAGNTDDVAGLIAIDMTAPDADLMRDVATTMDVDETNFSEEMDLGVFDAFHISVDNDTDDDGMRDTGETSTRVLLFTDKEQASAPIPQEIVTINNAAVTSGSRIGGTIGEAGDGELDPHDFTGSYDHDGNPATPMLEGTFLCVDPTLCSHTRTGTGADTAITAISGYRFTGMITVAAVPSMEDDTYLAFGVWLMETVADATNDYAFGAFAGGGSPYDPDVTNAGTVASIEGTATYEGSAAGVHSTATRVNFFSGDATLNADFGDGDAVGMITGEIDNIVAGGNSVDDSIYLYLSDQDVADPMPSNIDANGTFDGRTRMGSGTLGDDGEYDYPFNGTWNGEFFNQVLDDTDTTVTESEMAPGSVAGTFSVSRGDDDMTMMVDETESYVGAFGAHQD